MVDITYAGRLLSGDDAVEVEADFAGDGAADAFDEAVRLVVFLAAASDFVELHARRDREGRLIDDLIAGIEIWHDEMTRGAVGEHAERMGVAVGRHTGEAGEQPVVEIDDSPAGVFPTGCRREDAHVAGQHDIVDIVLVEERDHFFVVGVSLFVADVVPLDAELLGHAAAAVAVADHDGGFGGDAAVANRP